ncbi:EamA family transporter [Paenibacillus wulumuqiensis]|uniref:EamA family transporter n=1 Tax=Paenibacillus wulumuqiensis TaxID=1567107 RepID=UPI0006962F85|nr:EamA family transporter [Paenibacillus wulumuqiensis]
MIYVLLLLTILSNVTAQLILKKGVSSISLNEISIKSIGDVLVSPYIWSGLFLYGLSFVFYIVVLSKSDLSKAAPITQSLTILLIVLFSVFVLNEPLGTAKALGIILVLLGVYLIML